MKNTGPLLGFQPRRPSYKERDRATWAGIVSAVGKKVDLTDVDVRRFADVLLEAIRTETWRSGRVAIPDFGSWAIRRRKARKVLSPSTRKPHKIPGGRAVFFRASKNWRRRDG